jgi:hypothetical protein
MVSELRKLRFIPVSEITLDLEKSYRTKYFYQSIYVPCMAGYDVGIFHQFLVEWDALDTVRQLETHGHILRHTESVVQVLCTLW